MHETERKLWHGIPGEASLEPGPGGKQIKSLRAIRNIAIKQAQESSATHPRFRCPGCELTFLLTYGRMSRTQWPTEYEFWCLDCIRDLALERQKTGSAAKRTTVQRGLSMLR